MKCQVDAIQWGGGVVAEFVRGLQSRRDSVPPKSRFSGEVGSTMDSGPPSIGSAILYIMHKRMLASPRGDRLPAQVADHLSDAADVVVSVASVPGRSALNHVKLISFSGYVGPIP